MMRLVDRVIHYYKDFEQYGSAVTIRSLRPMRLQYYNADRKKIIKENYAKFVHS